MSMVSWATRRRFSGFTCSMVRMYYTIATPSDYLQWAVTTWWDKALDKPAAPAQAKSAKP